MDTLIEASGRFLYGKWRGEMSKTSAENIPPAWEQIGGEAQMAWAEAAAATIVVGARTAEAIASTMGWTK